MGKDVVTSFRVDGDLWKEAKIYAIKKEITIKELIENLLRRELGMNKGGKNGTEDKE